MLATDTGFGNFGGDGRREFGCREFGWRQYFTIIGQLRGYQPEWLMRDVAAGFAIAAVALPIGVAYPEIARLPPETGLYASIFGLIGYALFGSSRQLIVGPDAATLTGLAASQ